VLPQMAKTAEQLHAERLEQPEAGLAGPAEEIADRNTAASKRQQQLLQHWQSQLRLLLLLHAWQQALPLCHRDCQKLQLMHMRLSSSNGSWLSSSNLSKQQQELRQYQHHV
jgi:hypothetical protein